MAQEIQEHDLPGIGKRYDLSTVDGDISVVIHHSGRRDLYVTEKEGAAAAPTVVSLSDDQSRRLGALMAGAYFQPTLAQRIEAVVGGLVIDWVTLSAGSPADGHSIADLQVRKHTRMTIVAVVRGESVVVVPEPSETLSAGDTLVVIGQPQDLPGFVRHVAG